MELRAEHQGGSGSLDDVDLTGQLTLQLTLHNDGPRDVRILDASLGGYQLVRADLQVPAGRSAPMALEQTVTCDPETPPVTPPGGLRLTVRTTATKREVEIDLPYDEDEVARLCGFRPLDSMEVQLSALGRPAPDVLDLALELRTRALAPVHLTAVEPPPGVAVQVRLRGAPRGLPLELEPLNGVTRAQFLELRFTVHDCDAARVPADADLPTPEASTSLLVQVRDDAGSTGDAFVPYPDRLLESLVSESCR